MFGITKAAVLLVALGDGAECAIYRFDAVVIALYSRAVVPETAWLKLKGLVSA